MVIKVDASELSVIFGCLHAMLDTFSDYLASIENPYDLDIDGFNIWIDATRHKSQISSVLDKLRLVIDNE